MAGSVVPAALLAINTLVDSALPGWQVIDGPTYDLNKSKIACVGFTGNPDEPGVTTSRMPADVAMLLMQEMVDVACLLTGRAGKADLPTVRAMVFDAFAAVEQAVAADTTLGGLVSKAYCSSHQLLQSKSETGYAAALPFVVHFDAWR